MKGLLKGLAIIVCLLFNLQVLAQTNFPINVDEGMVSLQSFSEVNELQNGENIIKVTGNAYNNSTAIPITFVKTILQNGFITDEMKNKASGRLKNFNYHDVGYGAGLSWYHKWGDSSMFKNSVTSVSLRQRSINLIRYSKDAFNLVFFGNAMYAGDTARLTGSKFLGLNFRQLQFGWQKSFGKADSAWTMFVSVSLLQGISANDAFVGRGNLYTEPNGEYLDLTSSFLYWSSDTTSRQLQKFKGIGASGDLALSFPLGKKGNFKFYLNDLGFITWSKQSRRYSQDSSIHFEGVEVNNLFAFQDTSFLHYNTDTILKLAAVKKVYKSFTTSLPVYISMVYEKSILHTNGVFRAGIRYRPAFDAFPLLFVSFSSYKPKFIYPTVIASYGGAEGFSAGVALSKVLAKRVYISAGCDGLLGLILPDDFTSASAFTRLSVRF